MSTYAERVTTLHKHSADGCFYAARSKGFFGGSQGRKHEMYAVVSNSPRVVPSRGYGVHNSAADANSHAPVRGMRCLA